MTKTKKKPSHDLIIKDDDLVDASDDAETSKAKKPDAEKSDESKDKKKPSNAPTKFEPEDDLANTTLDSDIIEASLEEATPDLEPSSSSASPQPWNSMLYSLLLYKARWGDMNVSPSDPEHANLHAWIQDQRSQYKLYQERGMTLDNNDTFGDNDDGGDDITKKNTNDTTTTNNETVLTPDRISVLDTVGFHWNIKGDVFWQKHYDSLVAYKKEFGDVKVPRLYSKNSKLGEWVTDQRRQLKARRDGRPSMMTDERKQKLDEIGFVWKVRERADWNDRYEQLLEYKKENGNCVVPQHYAQNRALGKWVAKQREQYRFYHSGKHSFLTEERIDLLKSLGFVWRVKGKKKQEVSDPREGDSDDDDDDGMEGVLSVPHVDNDDEEEEDEKEKSTPKKKTKKRKKKAPPPKKAKKVAKKNKEEEEEEETSDVDDEDDDDEDDDAQSLDEEDKKTPADAMSRPSGVIPSVNGMGLLASVTDQMQGIPNAAGMPSLPSLPNDQQLIWAEHQHAMRASLMENVAARVNFQMESAQQKAMASSQTMADIAAALARQSRFGNGFAGASGMGMFANMPNMNLPGVSGVQMPNMANMPRENDVSEENLENLRNLSRMI